jgi:hypothetical protein
MIDDKRRPLAYLCLLPNIVKQAAKIGYTIAVHGSLQRDLDLIAVPWTDDAVAAEDLVEMVKSAAGGYCPDGEFSGPFAKPNGRRVWTIQLGASCYIDLSVMPTQKIDKESAELKEGAAYDAGWRAHYQQSMGVKKSLNEFKAEYFAGPRLG